MSKPAGLTSSSCPGARAHSAVANHKSSSSRISRMAMPPPAATPGGSLSQSSRRLTAPPPPPRPGGGRQYRQTPRWASLRSNPGRPASPRRTGQRRCRCPRWRRWPRRCTAGPPPSPPGGGQSPSAPGPAEPWRAGACRWPGACARWPGTASRTRCRSPARSRTRWDTPSPGWWR